MPTLCQRVLGTFPGTETAATARQLVVDFFSNRFAVVPDVSTHIGQVVQSSTQLASGLADWVPKISHTSNLFVIEATAGSGKTQLALNLLQTAAQHKQRACYVCFNRPLADHLAKLAPASVEVTTFHQLCRDWAERQGAAVDFSPQKCDKQQLCFPVSESELAAAQSHIARARGMNRNPFVFEDQELNPTTVNTPKPAAQFP